MSPSSLPLQISALLFYVLLNAFSTAASAADFYILPKGTGSQTGQSWADAKPGDEKNFKQTFSVMSPGDTLHVGSGEYGEITLTGSNKGSEGKPIRLLGESVNNGGLPVMTSTFDKANPAKTGAIFFEARDGASNFEIEGFQLRKYRTAVRLMGHNVHVKLLKLQVDESRDAIIGGGGGTPENPDAATHDVTMADCNLIHFTKRGVRFLDGTYDWHVLRCVADGGGKEWATEPWQECFHVIGASKDAKKNPPAPAGQPAATPATPAKEEEQEAGGHPGADCHHIEFIDCVARNTWNDQGPDKYWNADGFCVEAGNHHLRYVRCFSADHTDGGWDDKSVTPEVIDCIAVRCKRNFRLWRGATMVNCVSAFSMNRGGNGGSAGVWTHGNVVADHCTFYNNNGFAAEADGTTAKIELKNCVVALTDPSVAKPLTAGAVETSSSTVLDKPLADKDPQFAAPRTIDDWKSATAQFDSKKYGAQAGFSSARIK